VGTVEDRQLGAQAKDGEGPPPARTLTAITRWCGVHRHASVADISAAPGWLHDDRPQEDEAKRDDQSMPDEPLPDEQRDAQQQHDHENTQDLQHERAERRAVAHAGLRIVPGGGCFRVTNSL